MDWFYSENWPTCLWRLRSPTTCCLQAGTKESPGGNSVQIQKLESQEAYGVSPKSWGGGNAISAALSPKGQKHQSPRAGEEGCPSRSKESHLLLHLLFSSWPPWIGWCPPGFGTVTPLHSLLTPVLIFSGDTLTHPPGTHVLPGIWFPLA